MMAESSGLSRLAQAIDPAFGTGAPRAQAASVMASGRNAVHCTTKLAVEGMLGSRRMRG
jgi:hypothetical protein